MLEKELEMSLSLVQSDPIDYAEEAKTKLVEWIEACETQYLQCMEREGFSDSDIKNYRLVLHQYNDLVKDRVRMYFDAMNVRGVDFSQAFVPPKR